MKKLFIFCFVFLLQHQCMSSEKEEENIQTMERTGDKIFYPKEYNDYNNFKEEYIEKEYIKNLLCYRLKILENILTSDSNSGKLYNENLLNRNSIAIISNYKKGDFDTSIFNIKENYDIDFLINNAKKVSLILNEKVKGNKEAIEKIDNFILRLENHQR